VRLFGETAHRFSRRPVLGYLAQRAQLAIDAPATVREVVAAGTIARAGIFGHGDAAGRGRIDAAIERVGLGDLAARRLAQLSGGQQQRAFVAKALVGGPELLVLDEPTTGVDAASQEALAELLDQLHRDLAVTVIYVSHEFGAVERYVDRLVLVRGGIVFDGPPGDLPGVWHDPSHAHA
jgi:zinc transport system ATP-binding protein